MVTAPAELEVTVDAVHADAVTDTLWVGDPSAVEERAGRDGRITLVAGYASRKEAEGVAATLTRALRHAFHDLSVTERSDQAWLDHWRDHAQPVRAGRFLVDPAWLDRSSPTASGARPDTADPDIAPDTAPDTVTIRLDPGRAFGSGSHPTTRLMLRAVDGLVVPGMAVLDVGCGSGVLAVAAAALGASPVIAVDIDAAARSATVANAEANGVAGSVSASLDPLSSVDGSFDVVLANLLASTIETLAVDLTSRLAPTGRLVLCGLLGDRWQITAALFPGCAVSSVEEEDGWVAVTLEGRPTGRALGPSTWDPTASVRCLDVEATPPVRSRLASRTSDISPFRVVEVMERAWMLERSGRSVIRLCVGEPDFGTPRSVVEAAQRSLDAGTVHYTSSLGLPPLRDAISDYYAERFGIDVPARRIVVTSGASGALLLALAATVDREDGVLLADPGYPCNRHFVRTFEGRPVPIPVGPETAYQLTADLVDQHWTDATRGVLAATPANPTGTTIAPTELASIAAAANARHGVAYVDEIYGELVFDDPPTTVLSSTDDVFVVNSCSKTFGMTGWRVGWLVCPDWAHDAVEALAQNLYIAPPTPSQWAARAAFTPAVWDIVADRRAQFCARRDLLVGGLTSLGFHIPVLPTGAFYVYADCSDLADDSSELVTRLLEEAGVAVTPGNDFGDHRAEEHVRFSTTRPLDQLTEALERMARVLGS
jgi:ribosomal protein L11 methyltransferase